MSEAVFGDGRLIELRKRLWLLDDWMVSAARFQRASFRSGDSYYFKDKQQLQEILQETMRIL